MKENQNKFNQKASTRLQFIQFFLAIYFVILTSILGFYVAQFGSNFSPEHDRWGQFGDFLGGILNPLTSFFTLIVAIFVWSLQSKELAETRSVLNEQTRINRLTFADQMLMYHFDAISSCISQVNTTVTSLPRGAVKVYGDDALREVLGVFKAKEWTELDTLQTEYFQQQPIVKFAMEQWTPLHNAIRVTVKYIENTFDPAEIESRIELLRLRTTLYTQLSFCYYVSFTRDSELLAISRRADLLKYFQPNEVKDWLYKKANF